MAEKQKKDKGYTKKDFEQALIELGMKKSDFLIDEEISYTFLRGFFLGTEVSERIDTAVSNLIKTARAKRLRRIKHQPKNTYV